MENRTSRATRSGPSAAALIRTVENGLILAKAPGFYIQLFVGLTIVVAATINKLMEGRTS